MARRTMARSEAATSRTWHLFRTCGMIGLIGCASVVAADVIAWMLVEGYNPISQTISDLAVGDGSWLIDLGLFLFGAAYGAAAVGLFSWRLAGLSWTLGAAAMVLLGIDVLVIAMVNQYAGTANRGGDIHISAVYALGVLFAFACLLVVPGLKKLPASWYRFSLIIGVFWIIASPFFFLVPDGWEGAYERFLGLILVGWLLGMSWLLLKWPDGHSSRF